MPHTKKTNPISTRPVSPESGLKSHNSLGHTLFCSFLWARKGFTLVELIVTITIIAILWVIAFTAFKGFESSARDSTRSSDLANLSQWLDTSYIKTGSYPNPDNAFTVTYSGWSLWYQWTVWDTLINILSSNGSKLSKKPTDPLSPTREYTYSKSAYGNTYELSSNWEWDSLACTHLIPQAFAASGNPLITYVKGNYNGMVAKTVTGSTIYVIATPSITTSTGTVGSNIDVTTLSGKLLYHGQTNSWGIAYTPTLIYSSWALPTNDTASGITNFTNALKTAYSGSVISYNSNIQNVLTTTWATNITNLWANIITNYLGWSASAPPLPPVAGYSLSNSLLFDSASSQYLSRTPSVVGNRKKWTWSGWVKVMPGKQTNLFWVGDIWSNDTLLYIWPSSSALTFLNRTAWVADGSKTTSALFRDPSSWYHIILSWDSTNSTPWDRIKLYVNNVRQASFTTDSDPNLNTDSHFNKIAEHRIGNYSNWYNDGYLADVNFVDSGALDPTAFGYADLTTNQWLPKQYTGTYGTNGFRLDFSSGASLGKDANGTNNWTVNGGMTAAANQVIDTPLNNFATLNPLIRRGDITTPTTLSNWNLKTLHPNAGGSATYTFGTTTISSGKWYWENTITNLSNVIVFGIDTGKRQALSNTETIYYQSDTGNKVVYGTSSAYGSTFTTNDIIGVALDLDNLQITFYKNNVSQGMISGLSALSYVPIGQGNTSDSYVANFWQWWQADLTYYPDAWGKFKFQPPSGFKALSTANLSDPTIKNPKQYFDILTYIGNGWTQGITGLGFQPDFVWIKTRSNPWDSSHALFDSSRGIGKRLSSDSTSSEIDLPETLKSFDSNWFTLWTNVTVNRNLEKLVAWNWKKWTTPGFDIVSYTGTATARTISHSLGSVPRLIILKDKTVGNTYSWNVYHADLGATKALFLENPAGWFTDTPSSLRWNDTPPTPTIFSLGSSAAVNGNTHSFIAYLWSEVPGFSKFGSYTGNGNSDGVGTASTGDGPFVYTGFRPRYILVKNTGSSTSQWFSIDSSRDSGNPMIHDLFPSANYTESTSTNWTVDFLSNGFKIRGLDYQINGNGQTHIYAAFAEAPFKYANAR